MNTKAADLANEYFIECERLVVVPVLTQREVPYKNMEKFYGMYGIHERFKEAVEELILWESEADEIQHDSHNKERDIDRLKDKVSELKSEIDDCVDALEKLNIDNDELQEIIQKLNDLT